MKNFLQHAFLLISVIVASIFFLPSTASAAPLSGGLCGVEFTTSGTYEFSVPAGVTQISVTATGGGAGGGGSAWDSNETSPGTGGGGGGAAVQNLIISSLGATYSATIGSAGVGGVPNWNIWGGNPVGTGGESTLLDINGITSLLLPGGGTSYDGGDYYNAGGPAGGSGGTAGGSGYRACGGVGGSGGNTLLGVGGATTYGVAVAGSNGTGFGAGGSGASAGCYGAGAAGGNGAGGYMRIEWACPAVNTIPSASIVIPTADTSVMTGQDVFFSGTGSDLDAGDSITGYEWRENSCDASGTLLSSVSSFALSNPTVGTRTIYLRVKDESEAWSTNCPHRVITVSAPVAPDIVSANLSVPSTITLGQTVTFTADTKNQGVVGMDTTNAYKLIKLGGAPSLVGSALFDVTVVGDYAYTTVVGNDQDIETFNISNPYNPVNMGAIETWFNGNFEILNRGGYLYAMKGDSGQVLHVFDISTPGSPSLVGSTPAVGGSAMLGMDIVGSYAYLATNGSGQDGLEIFDITNPISPFEVGTPGTTVSHDDTASEAAVLGDYAYLAGQAYDTSNGAGFIDVFNVSNRTSPIRGVRIFTPSTIETAVVNDSYLYVNSGTNMRIYSLFDPANPLFIKEVSVNVDIQKIRIIGRYAYIIGYTATNGVRIYDVTNPTSPVLVGRATASSGSSSILPTQTKVYTANSNSVVGGNDLDIFEPHTLSRFCIDNPSCLTTTTGQLGGKDFDTGTLAVNGTYATSTTWTATPGAHTLYYCTDVQDTNGLDGVAESNETNNCQSVTFTVSDAPTKTTSLSPLSQTLTLSNSITFTSTASFSDNSMIEHNLNWRKQGGCWNWDTSCYVTNANATQSNYAFPATGAHNLSTTLIPTETGTYEVQAAAFDGTTWVYSSLATITIGCSAQQGSNCVVTNICSMSNTGTIQCNGTCNAMPPDETLCPVASNCGNGVCEGAGIPVETLITCPADCKVKVKQF